MPKTYKKKKNDSIRAYRIGTSKSKYKITVDPEQGVITNFEGGTTGIDISFGSDQHALYYAGTKKDDPNAVLVTWDFPIIIYEMIVHRMQHPHSKQKGNTKWDDNIWKIMLKIKAPTNSSDQIVRSNNLIAPHFSKEWIDFLNAYGRGSNAEERPINEFINEESEDDDEITDDTEGWLICADEVIKELQYSEFRRDYAGDADFIFSLTNPDE